MVSRPECPAIDDLMLQTGEVVMHKNLRRMILLAAITVALWSLASPQVRMLNSYALGSVSEPVPVVAQISADDAVRIALHGSESSSGIIEVGTNDFRISDMGPDGDVSFKANDAVVAYNPTNNEYLVAWTGHDDTGSLVAADSEIFGQRIDAATGAEVGANDFRISDMGPDGSPSFRAHRPAVAHNPTNNEFLVVWYGDDDTSPLVDNEREVFGQRLLIPFLDFFIGDTPEEK